MSSLWPSPPSFLRIQTPHLKGWAYTGGRGGVVEASILAWLFLLHSLWSLGPLFCCVDLPLPSDFGGECLPSSVLLKTTLSSWVQLSPCNSFQVSANNMPLGSGLDTKQSAAAFLPMFMDAVWGRAILGAAHCVLWIYRCDRLVYGVRLCIKG